jgi:hypothetical protein
MKGITMPWAIECLTKRKNDMEGLLDEVMRLREENKVLKHALIESIDHNERMKVALVDVLSIFGNKKDVPITPERIEAWQAALINYRP